MDIPDFSIVVCNYNYAHLVGAAIESCLAQDYPAHRFEIVVVDDGSTDDSRQVLEGYRSHPGVRLLFQENLGQAGAVAEGVARARGRFVCLLDSDDFYGRGKLRRVADRIAALEPLPEAFFLNHDVHIYDDTVGAPIKQTWFEVVGVTSYGNVAGHATTRGEYPFAVPCGQVYSRLLIGRVLDALPVAAWPMGIDTLLGHCSMLSADVVHYLHEPLAYYRVHGNNDRASIVRGQYGPKSRSHGRTPRMLRDLGRYAITQETDTRSRSSHLGYIARKQRVLGMLPLGAGPDSPAADLVVLAGDDPALTQRTLAACLAQTHDATNTVVAGSAAQLGGLEQGDGEHLMLPVVDGASQLARLGDGYRAGQAPFVAFFTAGELPRSDFVESHLHAHSHRSLAAATLADARTTDAAGAIRHGSLFEALGIRVGPETYAAPFTRTLKAGAFAPLGAHLLRRTRLLDALFARTNDPVLDTMFGPWGHWLVLQLTYGIGGCSLLGEALSTIPLGADGQPDLPRLQARREKRSHRPPDAGVAGELLFDLVCRDPHRFGRAHSRDWRRRLVRWLGTSGISAVRLRAIADAASDEHFVFAIGE